MGTQEETERIRETARAIIERAKTDPAYLDKLRDRPEETIRAAGVPEWAVAQLAQEITPAEVQGYAAEEASQWWPPDAMWWVWGNQQV